MGIKNMLRKRLISSDFGSVIWGFLHSANLKCQSIYSDEEYFKKAYKRNSGKTLDFSNPQTFDEKQLWIKMFYRNPLYTKCTDKFLVREYVESCGLGHILNTLYATYDSVDEIDWDKLPNKFYLKANHTSAGNIRCDDKTTIDRKKVCRELRRTLKHNHYYDSREWNYREIQPKIISESILENEDKSPLVDYRFLCYEGKCEYLFVDINTADEKGRHREDARRNVYDKDMNLLEVTVTRPRFDPTLIKKPENYDLMVEYAEKLSKQFPFCRVDLYNISGKIVFGEITFFHSGGLSKITPEEWQYKLGKDIPIKKLRKEMEQMRR